MDSFHGVAIKSVNPGVERIMTFQRVQVKFGSGRKAGGIGGRCAGAVKTGLPGVQLKKNRSGPDLLGFRKRGSRRIPAPKPAAWAHQATPAAPWSATELMSPDIS